MIIRLNKQQKRDFVDKGLLKILVSKGDNTHFMVFLLGFVWYVKWLGYSQGIFFDPMGIEWI